MDQPIYWPSVFFLLFGAVACAFAVAVVLSANIVRMAFYLVMSLAATAGLFFLAGADFVGSMQMLDLRRRHARALGVRRDAHFAGSFHFDEDEPRGNVDRRAGRRLPAIRAGRSRRSACRNGEASIGPRRKRFHCSRPRRPIGMGLLGHPGRWARPLGLLAHL